MNSLLKLWGSPRSCGCVGSRLSTVAFSNRFFSSTSEAAPKVSDAEKSEKPVFLDELPKITEKKRNKSRLTENQRRRELDLPPKPNELSEKRKATLMKLYGTIGKRSGVDPSVCWPTEEKLDEWKEKERLLYPNTLQEMMDNDKAMRTERDTALDKRKKEILQKMNEISEFRKKIDMKKKARESEYNAQKEKREHMLEEIRQFFGYRIDHRDPRFKEMVERKEEEEKKKQKEMRKQEKQAKMLAKLASMAEKSMQEMEASKKASQPEESKTEKPQT